MADPTWDMVSSGSWNTSSKKSQMEGRSTALDFQLSKKKKKKKDGSKSAHAQIALESFRLKSKRMLWRVCDGVRLFLARR